MYQKKLEEDIRCPLEYGISVISGKWKSRIICLLGSTSPMRFRDIKENLPDISDGVLSATLNELVQLDMLTKSCDGDSHSLIEYRPTEKALSLLPVLRGICRWSGNYYRENPDSAMQHCRSCSIYQSWAEDCRRQEEESSQL